MKRRRSLVIIAVAALLMAGCTQRRLQSPRAGERLGVPVDVNDRDVVLTAGTIGSASVGFLFDIGNRSVRVLRAPGGADFTPHALNNAGVVVGAVVVGTGRTLTSRAARWTSEGGFMMLPLPAGTFQSWATDINSRGQVVVNSFSPSGSPADGAYVWQPGTGVLDRLGEPAGAPNGRPSVGEAINDLGVVVGASGNGSGAGRERALLWDRDRRPELLGSPGDTGRALDVNEEGTVVGAALVGPAGSGLRAAAWSARGHRFIDLGPGSANDLNNHDVAVGQLAPLGATPRANLWYVPERLSIRLGDPTFGGPSNANAVNERHAVGDADGDTVDYPLAP